MMPGVDGNGPKRFSVQRKMAIVARLLRGEPLELVVRETNVSIARLSEWRDRALTGAATALKERERDDRDDEIARCFQAGISSRTARSRGSAARWVGRVEVSVIMVSPFMTRRVHLTFEVRGTGLVPFRHHLGRHRTQAVVLQARAPLPFSANKSPSGSPRTGLLRPPAWAEATRWRRGVRRLGAGG